MSKAGGRDLVGLLAGSGPRSYTTSAEYARLLERYFGAQRWPAAPGIDRRA